MSSRKAMSAEEEDAWLADEMRRFEERCEASGVQATPIRSRVFEALARSPKPLGVYDLTDLVPGRVRRISPISVYRALDALIAAGLVRRLETTKTFMVASEQEGLAGRPVALICATTGAVREVAAPELIGRLRTAANERGFRISGWTLELTGHSA